MRDKAILLVEDNPDDEKLTLLALEENKIVNQVVVVRDGAEALDYLFGSATEHLPQLVLLDLKLPKVDGLEVLRRMRSDPRTQMIPVVILTCSREERDLVAGYRSGANSYICKPVDFAQFIGAVQQLGLYWLVLNQVPISRAKS